MTNRINKISVRYHANEEHALWCSEVFLVFVYDVRFVLLLRDFFTIIQIYLAHKAVMPFTDGGLGSFMSQVTVASAIVNLYRSADFGKTRKLQKLPRI